MGFPSIGEGLNLTVCEDQRLGTSVLEDGLDPRRGARDPSARTEKGGK